MSKMVALVPAAGVGSRFGADVPKQYVRFAGKTVLEHTLACLLADKRIAHIAVVVSPDDAFCADLRLPERTQVYAVGGETRAQTVYNGLQALLAQQQLCGEDVVLVHDAARCCLPADALARLLNRADAPHGALLAVPLADTLKRDNGADAVAETVPRAGLWQAQTPQLFRADLLQRALAAADLNAVTDEASAVEALGLQPELVPGDSRNLKLTRTEDAQLFACLLDAQAAGRDKA